MFDLARGSWRQTRTFPLLTKVVACWSLLCLICPPLRIRLSKPSCAPLKLKWRACRPSAAHHAERERYRLSQVRFRTVFEHSPLGHKIIAADLTIRQANAAVAALLGLASPLDLLGHTILEFAHPDYVADWARLQVAL